MLFDELDELDDDDDDDADADEPSNGVLSRRSGPRLSDSSNELIEAEVLADELDRTGGKRREASVGDTRG